MTHIMGLDMFVRTKMALSVIQISTGLVFLRQNSELELADTEPKLRKQSRLPPSFVELL